MYYIVEEIIDSPNGGITGSRFVGTYDTLKEAQFARDTLQRIWLNSEITIAPMESEIDG